ncbi:MAG TPA: hypothetical protein VJZ49_03185 [Syntrophales bacterium]|nr:hypothetical protein [Syntrophales bacterium]
MSSSFYNATDIVTPNLIVAAQATAATGDIFPAIDRTAMKMCRPPAVMCHLPVRLAQNNDGT